MGSGLGSMSKLTNRMGGTACCGGLGWCGRGRSFGWVGVVVVVGGVVGTRQRREREELDSGLKCLFGKNGVTLHSEGAFSGKIYFMVYCGLHWYH